MDPRQNMLEKTGLINEGLMVCCCYHRELIVFTTWCLAYIWHCEQLFILSVHALEVKSNSYIQKVDHMHVTYSIYVTVLDHVLLDTPN